MEFVLITMTFVLKAESNLHIILGAMLGVVAAACVGLLLFYLKRQPQKAMKVCSFLGHCLGPCLGMLIVRQLIWSFIREEVRLAMRILFEVGYECIHACHPPPP